MSLAQRLSQAPKNTCILGKRVSRSCAYSRLQFWLAHLYSSAQMETERCLDLLLANRNQDWPPQWPPLRLKEPNASFSHQDLNLMARPASNTAISD